MAVTDIPITEEDDDRYTYATLPFGCITTESTIVTVCLNETSIINDLMAGRYVKDFNIHKRTRFVLQLQYVIAKNTCNTSNKSTERANAFKLSLKKL